MSTSAPLSVNKPRGFTLVELLVVISIIAILSVVGMAVFTGVQKGARDAKRRADVDAVSKAYEVKYNNTGSYGDLNPEQNTDLFASKQFPKDPKGEDYTITQNPSTGGFRICATLEGDSQPSCKTSTQEEPPPLTGGTPETSRTVTSGQAALGNSCPASLSDGLAGHWTMDDNGSTVADATGNNNGTAVGTTTVTGKIGQARGLRGGNSTRLGDFDYINAPIGTYFGGNNPLTASAWVYVTSNTNGPVFGVTRCPPWGCWNMPFLSVVGTTVYGWIWKTPNNLAMTASVNPDSWHLLTITYNPTGAGQQIFYVDGQQVANDVGQYQPSGGFNYFTTALSGARTGNSHLNGIIDDVRVYTRVLSPTEISELWGGSQGCMPY